VIGVSPVGLPEAGIDLGHLAELCWALKKQQISNAYLQMIKKLIYMLSVKNTAFT
jgi:hypothetical protein